MFLYFSLCLSFFFFSLCLLNFFPPCYNGCILESVLSQVEFCTSFDNGWSPVNISAIREVCQVSCLILSGRQRRAAFMRGGGGVVRCPGVDGWAVPGPAWRSCGLIWHWFPGELVSHPHTFSQGWLAGKPGRQREKAPVRCEMRQNQGAVGEVSYILVTLPYLCLVQPVLFKLFFKQ